MYDQQKLNRSLQELNDSGVPKEDAIVTLFKSGVGIYFLSQAVETTLQIDGRTAKRLVITATSGIERQIASTRKRMLP